MSQACQVAIMRSSLHGGYRVGQTLMVGLEGGQIPTLSTLKFVTYPN